MLFVVILNHEVIEISLVFQVLVQRLDTPALLVSGEHFLSRKSSIALEDIYSKIFLVLLEFLPGVAILTKLNAVLVVEATFLVLINVTENIHMLSFRDPFGCVLNPRMFLTGAIIEFIHILKPCHRCLEHIRVAGNRNDIGIIIRR